MGEPAQFIDNAKEIFDNSVIGDDRMVRTLTYMD